MEKGESGHFHENSSKKHKNAKINGNIREKTYQYCRK